LDPSQYGGVVFHEDALTTGSDAFDTYRLKLLRELLDEALVAEAMAC